MTKPAYIVHAPPLFQSHGKSELQLTSLRIDEGDAYKGYFADSSCVLSLREYQDALELSFALTNPLSLADVTYEYKLSGVDRSWVQSRPDRFVRYANLRGGYYTFSVRAIENGTTYERGFTAF